MRNTISWAINLFLILLPPLSAAAIPSAAITDTRYAIGRLVCNHYGIANNFTTDATAKINECIEDSYNNQLQAYLECGTYAISNSVVLYEWHLEDGVIPVKSHSLQGQKGCAGDGWPVLKVMTTAPNFDNENDPRPMVAFRAFLETPGNSLPISPPSHALYNPPGYTGRTSNPNKDGDGNYFNEEMHGFILDGNGHDGVIGLAMSVAQSSFLGDVKVLNTGGHTCFWGTPGRSMPAVNLECVGGRYGFYYRTGTTGTYSGDNYKAAGPTVVGAKMVNQTHSAIEHPDGVGPTFVGFEITRSADGIPIKAVSNLTLIDGKVTMAGAAAGDIVLDASPATSVFVRNLWVTGSGQLARQNGQVTSANAGPWARLSQWSYNDPFQYDGSTDPKTYPTYTSTGRFEGRAFINADAANDVVGGGLVSTKVDSNVTAPPTDLLSRHTWSSLPSFEEGYVAVTGATPYVQLDPQPGNTGAADTTALQNAVNAAAGTTHKNVALPRGFLHITTTITVPANVNILGAGQYKTGISYHNSWTPTSAIPFFQTADDATSTTVLRDFSMFIRNTPFAYDWQYYLRWRSGKNSMTWGLGEDSWWIPPCNSGPSSFVYNQPRKLNWFSGNGGGKHYGLYAQAQHWVDRNVATRQVYMDHTTQPTSFYGANMEMGKVGYACGASSVPNAGSETNGAQNVRFFGWKREGEAPTLRIQDSNNIAGYGSGRFANPPTGDAYIQVLGSTTNVLLGNAVNPSTNGSALNGGFQLRQALTGQTAFTAVPWPTRLQLYQLGQIDDAPFATTAEPPPTAPDKASIEILAADRIDLRWNIHDSTALIPTSGVTGIAVTVNEIPQSVVSSSLQGLDLYYLYLASGVLTLPTDEVTVAYTPGNIQAGGPGNPNALGFLATDAENQILVSDQPFLSQEAFAFRSIYGGFTEETSPWYRTSAAAYENVSHRFLPGARFRLPMQVKNTVAEATARTFSVCYRKNQTGPYLPLPDTCAASETCFTDAPDLPDSQAVPQTLTPSGGGYVSGGVLEHATTQVPVTLPINSETSYDPAILIKEETAVNSQFQYQLCGSGGSALNQYLQIPMVTVISLRGIVTGGGTRQ